MVWDDFGFAFLHGFLQNSPSQTCISASILEILGLRAHAGLTSKKAEISSKRQNKPKNNYSTHMRALIWKFVEEKGKYACLCAKQMHNWTRFRGT